MAFSGEWEVVRKKTKPTATNNENAKNQALVYLEKYPRFVNDYGSIGKESQFGVLWADGSRKTKTSTNNNKVEAAVINGNEKQKNGTAVPVVHKKPKKKLFQLEGVKVKLPKTMDGALMKVNSSELRAAVAMVQTRFVHSSNMWLAELVAFFNEKLNVETPDPLFASKDSNYPLSALSKEVCKILDDTIGKCSEPVLKAFFEKTLGDMVLEMGKGVRVNGQRLVLQTIIQHNPSLVGDNLVKFGNLRNTYQNKQNVCETVLWLASQAGIVNFDVGLRVWLQLLLPVIGMKSYSKFVVDYICDLFSWHSRVHSDAIGAQQFFPIVDIVFNKNAKLPPNLHQNIVNVYPKLKKVAFGRTPEKNLRNFFPTFLSRLSPSCHELLKTELLECLLYCLNKDTKCYVAWLQLYTRHLVQSSLLLEHLIENWDAVGPSLPLLKETLGEFNAANTRLSANLKNGVVNGLPQCKQHCKEQN